jgi:DNA polymerase-3 subunit epsilon
MITDLLTLPRPLIVLDTETTGLDTTNDRIVELAFQVYYHDGRDVKKYRTLVNPGVPIPAEATEVHGYKDEDFWLCRTCNAELAGHPIDKSDECVNWPCIDPRGWPTFKHLAPNLAVGFTNVDYAGKNIRFDLRILSAEFARAGVEWSIGDARIIDADRLEALLVPRSLTHLYKKYTDQAFPGAHGAMADVEAVAEVIELQLNASLNDDGDLLPHDLDALHALQWPTMIDLEGKFCYVKDVPCFTRWGKYGGKPMTAADVGYWDWILSKDFPVETKRIAAQAKLGVYPVRKA